MGGLHRSPLFFAFVGLIVSENGIKIIVSDKNIYDFYPNPATDYITITTENTNEKNIKLFDLQSHTIKSIITEQSTIQISVQDVPIGTYLLQIFNNGNLEVREIVIKN